MKIKVITNDSKMYTLPDKITIPDKIPTKEPKEIISDEKAQFLEDVKNTKIISLSDGNNYGLIKIPITEENMNRIVITTNENHTFHKHHDGKTPVKCRAYTIIPKGATKKIEFTLKQDGDIPFGLFISNSGYYLGTFRYYKNKRIFDTMINGFLLTIPNTTAYGIRSESIRITSEHVSQAPDRDGHDRKYLLTIDSSILAKKSFTTPYPHNELYMSHCLDFLGGEKFKTEGCRLILEEVGNKLILTNKETKLSLIYTLRDDEEFKMLAGEETEMQFFDFLFISRLKSEGTGKKHGDITQSSAIIEDLKYIN